MEQNFYSELECSEFSNLLLAEIADGPTIIDNVFTTFIIEIVRCLPQTDNSQSNKANEVSKLPPENVMENQFVSLLLRKRIKIQKLAG